MIIYNNSFIAYFRLLNYTLQKSSNSLVREIIFLKIKLHTIIKHGMTYTFFRFEDDKLKILLFYFQNLFNLINLNSPIYYQYQPQ